MLNAVVTTDGAPALIAAVEEAWPQSLRQRCVMRKTRNIFDMFILELLCAFVFGLITLVFIVAFFSGHDAAR